jgi:MFS family permease
MRSEARIAVEGTLPQPPAAAAPLPIEQPTAPARFRTLRPFSHRNFALFWSGALVSNIGTWLQNVALAWVVLELTESAFWVSMVTFTQFIPTLLFGLFGGLMADRLDRRRVLLVTQTMAMCFATALAVVTWTGHASVATLLPIIGAAGVTMAFNAPAFQALIPDLIPSRLILDAVSLNSTQFSIARVLGPALGGLILATIGAGWAFGVNALSFLAVIAALLMIRAERHDRPTSSGARALFGGVRAAYESRAITTLLVATAICSVFGAPVIALLSVMAKHVLDLGAGGYGGLFAMFSVGAVAGALATGALVRRFGLRMAIGTGMGILAVLIAAFAASRSLVISSILLVGIGAVYTMSVSATNSGLQTAVPARKRGRIMSLYMMAWGGLFPVGALIAGIVASHIGAPKTLGLMTIPLAIGAAAIVVAGHGLDAVPAKPGPVTA